MTRLFVIAEPDVERRACRAATAAATAAASLELAPSIEEADVVLVGPRQPAELRAALPQARRVRWIHALAAGVESLPLGEIHARGIVLTNSRGLYGDALAEFAIAAMLWFAKDLRRLDRNQAARRWEPFDVERLEGRTAGIIGYGGIGRAVGRRAEALGMPVLGARRNDPVDQLIASSDYLVLATPLTAGTRGLMSRQRLATMPSRAVLINVGRGALVDEMALVDELARIRGAALDVFETEPLPETSPLWGLDNVLISPHSADHTADSHERTLDFFLQNLERFEKGEPLQNVVDLARGY
ncbi:MAG TPA: D-2-hydroxyacid dehydrogenase [Thermoanaerobaculia bacterium]|nr:D-2-hydroxyacid dehydrogenase [Thermoanaerobaculia bacterium]